MSRSLALIAMLVAAVLWPSVVMAGDPPPARCRGVKVWYKGKCRYPDRVKQLKREEARRARERRARERRREERPAEPTPPPKPPEKKHRPAAAPAEPSGTSAAQPPPGRRLTVGAALAGGDMAVDEPAFSADGTDFGGGLQAGYEWFSGPHLALGTSATALFSLNSDGTSSPLGSFLFDLDATGRLRLPFSEPWFAGYLKLALGLSVATSESVTADLYDEYGFYLGEVSTDYEGPGVGLNVGLSVGVTARFGESLGAFFDVGYRYHSLWFDETSAFDEWIRHSTHMALVGFGIVWDWP